MNNEVVSNCSFVEISQTILELFVKGVLPLLIVVIISMAIILGAMSYFKQAKIDKLNAEIRLKELNGKSKVRD